MCGVVGVIPWGDDAGNQRPAANIDNNDNWETRKARVADFLEGVKAIKEEHSQIPALSLACAMLCERSASRPTAEDLLRHKFFCPNSPIQGVSSEPIAEAGVQGDGLPTRGEVGSPTPGAGFEFKA